MTPSGIKLAAFRFVAPQRARIFQYTSYLIQFSLTQMVVAMANFHYFTVGGKNNSDTDRRSLSVVSVSGEHVKCVTVLSLMQAQCFRHKT